MTNYRQLPRYSNSDLTEFKQILFSGKWTKPEKVFQFGSTFHELLLEPEKVNLELHDEQERDTLKGMVKAALEHDFLRNVIRSCKSEQVYLFDTLGIPCKAKLDLVYPNISRVYDLKSTAATSLEEFYQSFVRFDYLRQGAFYADAISATEATFIGISKIQPFDIFIINLTDDDLEAGREDYKMLLKMIQETNFVPSSWCKN